MPVLGHICILRDLTAQRHCLQHVRTVTHAPHLGSSASTIRSKQPIKIHRDHTPRHVLKALFREMRQARLGDSVVLDHRRTMGVRPLTGIPPAAAEAMNMTLMSVRPGARITMIAMIAMTAMAAMIAIAAMAVTTVGHLLLVFHGAATNTEDVPHPRPTSRHGRTRLPHAGQGNLHLRDGAIPLRGDRHRGLPRSHLDSHRL